MLSALSSLFGKKSPPDKLQEDKKREALPHAYFIVGERLAKQPPQYQFVAAAASGNVDKMKRLLSIHSKKIDIKKLSQDQQNKWFDALSAAVLNGQARAVEFLLDKRKQSVSVPITDQTFECAVLGNQITLLRDLVDVADEKELHELRRRIEGYMVTHGSTALAAALRQPLARTLVESLAVGLMERGSENYQKWGTLYLKKMKEMGPVHPVLVTLFANRVRSIYHLELQVAMPSPAEIPPVKSTSDLQPFSL